MAAVEHVDHPDRTYQPTLLVDDDPLRAIPPDLTGFEQGYIISRVRTLPSHSPVFLPLPAAGHDEPDLIRGDATGRYGAFVLNDGQLDQEDIPGPKPVITLGGVLVRLNDIELVKLRVLLRNRNVSLPPNLLGQAISLGDAYTLSAVPSLTGSVEIPFIRVNPKARILAHSDRLLHPDENDLRRLIGAL